jgi:hypothetical protein
MKLRKRVVFEAGLSLMMGGALDIVFFGARVDTWSGPVALGSFILGYFVVSASLAMRS